MQFGTVWSITECVSLCWLPSPAADDEKPPEPTNLACNTPDNEDEPHVSSDGRTLYYGAREMQANIWLVKLKSEH